jgi:prephenate dehydrogenase
VSDPRSLKATPSLDSWSQISVVGLGLIGGSMSLALREQLPQVRIVGIDRDRALGAAAASALADQYVSERDAAGVAQAFGGSDLIFLATPVSGIKRWLGQALQQAPLVTDCGSTKREIAAAAADLGNHFVPGHPMAGAGPRRSEARPDLFQGQPWILCPEGADPAALDIVEALVARVGARPVRMTAVAHDRAVALTSHAPRLVASVMSALVEREGAFAAAGPAFQRLVHGAGGSAEMWHDVLASNADEVARALRLVLAELQGCAEELEQGARLERSLAVLAAADQARSAFESVRRPDIERKPG